MQICHVNMAEAEMYKDQITGNWHILKGKARQRWGEYTNKDFDYLIAGWEEERCGKVQTTYGLSRKEADRLIQHWLETDHDPHHWSAGSSSGGVGGTMSISSF